MKLLRISLTCIIAASLLMLCSCIDSKYHWNNMNTEGVVDLPPIPLGSYKQIVLKDLGSDIIHIEGIPSITIEYTETLKNIFDHTTVRQFFYPGMKRDFSIDGIFDMHLFGKDSGAKIALDFFVLDTENNIIDGVKIKGIGDNDLVFADGAKDISIVFTKESAEYMTDAEHLMIKIRLTTPTSIELTEDHYVQLLNLTMKTAGIHVEL